MIPRLTFFQSGRSAICRPSFLASDADKGIKSNRVSWSVDFAAWNADSALLNS